jgi:hypothetical protein
MSGARYLMFPDMRPFSIALALANFNHSYAAFDVHLPRILARTGLPAYGWDMQLGRDAEFGTSPQNECNCLFLHGLLLHMSALYAGRFSPVDLDHVFWHFWAVHLRGDYAL